MQHSFLQFGARKVFATMFLLLATLTLLIALVGCGGTTPSTSPSMQTSWNFIQMVDADADATSYAYGPSIVKKDGVYHVFFCSAGPNQTWDAIRYVHSTDGKNWSAPVILFRASGANGSDLAACDPSVVFYRGFYYMFYSSAATTGPGLFWTVIQVARSLNIDGPYLTYTQRGTWEDLPTDAQIIIKPLAKPSENPIGYAAPLSVLVHNGQIFLWYVDNSLNPDAGVKAYLLKSTDPVRWAPSPSNELAVPANSFEVRFDPAKNRFVMTALVHPHAADAYLAWSFSPDGSTWSNYTTIIGVGYFPDYANNVGAAGDETGSTVPSPTLVGFGAPYDLNGFNNWGQWDLYGVMIDGPQ